MRALAFTAAVIGAVSAALGLAPAASAAEPGAAARRAAVAPAASSAANAAEADLDLLEFLGSDDEVDAELGKFLARPATRETTRPATPGAQDGSAGR